MSAGYACGLRFSPDRQSNEKSSIAGVTVTVRMIIGACSGYRMVATCVKQLNLSEFSYWGKEILFICAIRNRLQDHA